MHEIEGDLWHFHSLGKVIVLTTSGAVDKNGTALMPRGCARQALDRYPDLSQILGYLIVQHGNHVFDLGRRLVSFPVEESPYQTAEPKLIEQSCTELVELTSYKCWREVIMPQPGCGGGGLVWDDVKPIMERVLDERFKVIIRSG